MASHIEAFACRNDDVGMRSHLALLLIALSALLACGNAPPGTAPLNAAPSPTPETLVEPSRKLTQARRIEERWPSIFKFKTHSISETHEGYCPYEISADYPEALGTRRGVKRFNRWIKRKILADVARFRWLELRAEPRARKKGQKLLTEGLELSFDVYSANRELISLRLTHSVMASGQMHPIAYYETINYDLQKGRPLTANDVFRRGYLNVFSRYSRKFLTDNYEIAINDWLNEGTRPWVVNFENWNLVPAGVLLSFEDYQVNSHSFGQPELIVPYSELHKVIRRSVVRRTRL